MEQQPKCDRWCAKLNEKYKLPVNFRFTCAGANDAVVLEGESPESLIGQWPSVARSVVEQLACLAPDQQEIINPDDLPYGGIDPYTE